MFSPSIFGMIILVFSVSRNCVGREKNNKKQNKIQFILSKLNERISVNCEWKTNQTKTKTIEEEHWLGSIMLKIIQTWLYSRSNPNYSQKGIQGGQM